MERADLFEFRDTIVVDLFGVGDLILLDFINVRLVELPIRMCFWT